MRKEVALMILVCISLCTPFALAAPTGPPSDSFVDTGSENSSTDAISVLPNVPDSQVVDEDVGLQAYSPVAQESSSSSDGGIILVLIVLVILNLVLVVLVSILVYSFFVKNKVSVVQTSPQVSSSQPSPDPVLQNYIKTNLQYYPYEQIKQSLLQQGYTLADIERAYLQQ